MENSLFPYSHRIVKITGWISLVKLPKIFGGDRKYIILVFLFIDSKKLENNSTWIENASGSNI
jgi:hypothetical protein